jgi:hypothetical protein
LQLDLGLPAAVCNAELMIPEHWRSLLQNFEDSDAIFQREARGFRWEDPQHGLTSFVSRIGRILLRAFPKFGPMPSRTFELEVSGQLGDLRHPSIVHEVCTLSPEQELHAIREEHDTEIHEIMSHFGSGAYHADDLVRERESFAAHDAPPVPRQSIPPALPQNREPERVLVTIQRTVRDTTIVESLKRLYGYKCQFCGFTIRIPRTRGFYCEAHHIRPLGKPHHGSDIGGNILIACPNHHKMLDYGAIAIEVETLRDRRHQIDPASIQYHNEEIFAGTEQVAKEPS